MGNFRDADKYFNRPVTYLKNEHKLKEKTMESVFDYLEKNPTALVRGNVPIANIIERIKNRTGASYISKNDIPNFECIALMHFTFRVMKRNTFQKINCKSRQSKYRLRT